MTSTAIKITGMHCASCKTLIEEVCKELKGVKTCSVDLEHGTGVIEHDEAFEFSVLAKEVAALGGYAVEKL